MWLLLGIGKDIRMMRPHRTLSALGLALAVAACGSFDTSELRLNPFASTIRVENNVLAPTAALTTGPAPPSEYIGPDGSCPGASSDPNAPTAAGISLSMTECEVVRRAGSAPRVETNGPPGPAREAVLTFDTGDRAGIYRFRSGRLVSVERLPGAPAAERPVPKKKKTRART
jgi:hypothetical protein